MIFWGSGGSLVNPKYETGRYDAIGICGDFGLNSYGKSGWHGDVEEAIAAYEARQGPCEKACNHTQDALILSR